MRSVSNFDLEEYVDYITRGRDANLSATIRETVLKEVTDHEFLSRAFSTPEGKAVFNSAIDQISKEVSEIINKSIEGHTKTTADKIIPHAQNIRITYTMLLEWAKIFTNGQKHIEEIKKINQRST